MAHEDVCPTCGQKIGKIKGTRLPENWALPKPWGDWAMENQGWTRKEVEEAAETFRDYWIAKSGKDATKLDWFATWRNWIRGTRKGGRPGKPFRGRSLEEINAKAAEGFLEMMGARNRDEQIG
jgi:hypothetical protein